MDIGEENCAQTVMKRKPISFQMLIKRHLPPEAAKIWSQEDIFEKLNQISHVRLDREGITQLDGLELLGKSVTNLYLQSNHIDKIENLDTLTGLTFLTVGSNQVSRVEGLKHLSKLHFLDLSYNKIETLCTADLPSSLVIIDLRGNPCTKMPGYRHKMIQDLPNLQKLDGESVTREEMEQAGREVSDDEEEDDDYVEQQDIDENSHIEGIFKTVTSDILRRARQQMSQILKTHAEHMDTLDTIRTNAQLDFNKCDSRASGTHDVISVQHLESHDTRSQSSGSRSQEIAADEEEHLNNSRSTSPDSEQDSGEEISPEEGAGGVVLSPFGLLPEGYRSSSGAGSRLGSRQSPLGPISNR